MREVLFKKGGNEYKLVLDADNISYPIFVRALNLAMAGNLIEAGEYILIKQIDEEKSSPEILDIPLLKAQASAYCANLIEAYEVEEKKS